MNKKRGKWKFCPSEETLREQIRKVEILRKNLGNFEE